MKVVLAILFVVLISGCGGSPEPAIATDVQSEDDFQVFDVGDLQAISEDAQPHEIVEDVAPILDVSPTDVSEGPPDTPDIFDVPSECAPCAPSDAITQISMAIESLVSTPSRDLHNPLKGFMTSYLWGPPANDFPDQMEFVYLPLSDLWGANGETFEIGLEPHLVASSARGHHLVLRVYVDYPNKTSGVPEHLIEQIPCQPYTEFGGGCSPDYDHPLLLSVMLDFIAELGNRYDGDPRLGVFQVGLLGFWGEWHTFPHTDWFASNATQTALLEATNTAFSTTQLQVRRPAANSPDLRIGFHDDSFAHSTMGEIDWFFLPSLISAGAGDRWQEVMIGGELRPELQSICFEDAYTLGTNAQDVVDCIDGTHASYLLNYKAFNEDGTGYQGIERQRAEAAAIHMGYRFELTSASIALSGLDDGTVEATVTIELAQTGVAPFYYDIYASVHAEDGSVLLTHATNLKDLLPGNSQSLEFSLGRVPVSVVNTPLEIQLSSSILLPEQRVLLATTTPLTEEGGYTRLAWPMGCDFEGQALSLGDGAGEDLEGCPCLCDVDGKVRSCDGSLCSP